MVPVGVNPEASSGEEEAGEPSPEPPDWAIEGLAEGFEVGVQNECYEFGSTRIHVSHVRQCLQKGGIRLLFCRHCGGFSTGSGSALFRDPCKPAGLTPWRKTGVKHMLRGEWPTSKVRNKWGAASLAPGFVSPAFVCRAVQDSHVLELV